MSVFLTKITFLMMGIESSLKYKKVITSLQRNGLNAGSWTANGYTAATYSLIDDLAYSYDQPSSGQVNQSNQLLRITDGSIATKGFKYANTRTSSSDVDYAYDKNGNLTYDRHKGISEIRYNYLNLPMYIRIDDPLNAFIGGTIEFVYDASGAKLRKIVKSKTSGVQPVVYDYVNGVEYTNNVLQRIPHTEGAVTRNDFGAYDHEYVLRDHLGNARVTFKDGTNKGEAYMDWNTWTYIDPNTGNIGYNDGVITQEDMTQINHYYPFGLNMEGNWNGSFPDVKNKYQFNEKELNTDFGLNWNDYGARFYTPDAPRWTTIDPLAEKMRRYSPYNYCFDNPMRFVDPDGMEGKGVGINSKGVRVYDDGIDDGKLYYFGNNSSNKKVTSLEGSSIISNGYGKWSGHADTKAFFDALFTKIGYGAYLGYDIKIVKDAQLMAVNPGAGQKEVDIDGKHYLSFEYGKPTLELTKNDFNFNYFTLMNILTHEGFHLDQVSKLPKEDLWLNGEDYDYVRKIQLEIPAYEQQMLANDTWTQIQKLAGYNAGLGGHYPYEPTKSQKFFMDYIKLIRGNYQDELNKEAKYNGPFKR